MCGICGLWQFDGQLIEEREVQAMTDSLAHRGPDGAGVFIDENVALGHRRLAILDLTTQGHQPMSYGDERYVITYNGEIYNFLELKFELEQKGYTFQSQSDTEVVVASYHAWGAECLLKFNGMWAFAIWDRYDRRLFLARDRFGIKPLYYLSTAQRFAFASEMKAFLRLEWFTPEVDLSVLRAEIEDVHSQEGTENCLLVGVKRLKAGHFAIIQQEGTVGLHEWWRTDEHLVAVPNDLTEQTLRFRELFEDACRIRMRSDVPIGTCLSGGLDSSAVVSTVAKVDRQYDTRLASDWRRAFIATFPNTKVDERRFAELVVAQTGVDPVYIPIHASDAISVVEDTVYHLEQIYSAPPWGLWLLYKVLREENVVVTLDGHGGDELLAGYPHYVVQALYDSGHWTGNPLRYFQLLRIYQAMTANGGDSGPRVPLGELITSTSAPLRNLSRVARRVGLRPALGFQDVGDHHSWMGPALEGVKRQEPPVQPVSGGRSHFARTLHYDFHNSIMQVILRNYDRMSMAHGIEIRMPFLDWRLVTYAFSLPEETKIGKGFSKLVLREAMKGQLPDAVRMRRDKIGFSTPISKWMEEGIARWLLEIVNEPEFVSSSLWKGAEIRDWVMARSTGHVWSWTDFMSVWVYVNAYLWLRRFVGPIT